MVDHMGNQKIIAIGREFGSGGREIGEKLAQELGIGFYDRELISKAAKNSGIAEDMVELYDERQTDSFLYSLALDAYSAIGSGETFGQKIARAEFDAIRELAKKESFVIVGRCAEYILRENKNLTSIFVYGDMADKKVRVMDMFNITESEAKKSIYKTDSSRAAYHNRYCDTKWGDLKSYDMMINSSTVGIDNTVRTLVSFLQYRYDKARVSEDKKK